eukprot:COSAG02_NODE_24354_length_690_cov_4.113367_1_plen_87_part_00
MSKKETCQNHYPDIYRPEITCSSESSQAVTRDPHELRFLPEITGLTLLHEIVIVIVIMIMKSEGQERAPRRVAWHVFDVAEDAAGA